MRCRVGARPSRLLPRSAVAAIVSGSLMASSGAAAFGGETKPASGQPPPVQVAAVLVMARPISITAVTVMQAEAARIWGRYAVGIDWREPGPALDPSVHFVVVVSPESAPCVSWRADRADAIGCFPQLPEGNALPVIKVFPDRVRRLVDRGCQHLPSLFGVLDRAPDGNVAGSSARPRDRSLPPRGGAQRGGVDESEHRPRRAVHARGGHPVADRGSDRVPREGATRREMED